VPLQSRPAIIAASRVDSISGSGMP
jgi:hypothetical protein